MFVKLADRWLVAGGIRHGGPCPYRCRTNKFLNGEGKRIKELLAIECSLKIFLSLYTLLQEKHEQDSSLLRRQVVAHHSTCID